MCKASVLFFCLLFGGGRWLVIMWNRSGRGLCSQGHCSLCVYWLNDTAENGLVEKSGKQKVRINGYRISLSP